MVSSLEHSCWREEYIHCGEKWAVIVIVDRYGEQLEDVVIQLVGGRLALKGDVVSDKECDSSSFDVTTAVFADQFVVGRGFHFGFSRKFRFLDDSDVDVMFFKVME